MKLSVLGASCALVVLLARGVSAQPVPEGVNPKAADQTPPAPALEVECTGLDVAETERLLRVELAVIAARVERVRAPSVRIECARGILYIEVEDPASGGKKALTLPAPGAQTPDRERTVAIAASQLFLSSWLEMITGQKPPAKPRRRTRKPAPAPPRPTSVADLAPTRPAANAGWELGATGVLRFRHLGNAVTTVAPSLVVRRRFLERWLLQGELGVETAETARDTGDVDWLAGRAGAGFGVRAASGPYSLDTAISASLMVVHARGFPSASGVRGEENTAAALDLALTLTPAVRFSRFYLGVVAESGALYPRLTARVSGDTPASLHGPWAGVGIALGAEIAP